MTFPCVIDLLTDGNIALHALRNIGFLICNSINCARIYKAVEKEIRLAEKRKKAKLSMSAYARLKETMKIDGDMMDDFKMFAEALLESRAKKVDVATSVAVEGSSKSIVVNNSVVVKTGSAKDAKSLQGVLEQVIFAKLK